MESLYDEEDPRRPWRMISLIVLLLAALGLVLSFWFSRGGPKVISGRWLRMDTAIDTSFETHSEQTPEAFKALPPIAIPNLLLSSTLSGGRRARGEPAGEAVAAGEGSPQPVHVRPPPAAAEDDSADLDRLESEATAASIAAASVPPPALAPPPPDRPQAKTAAPAEMGPASPPAIAASASPAPAPPATSSNTLSPDAEVASSAPAITADSPRADALGADTTQAFFQMLSKHLTAANDRALAESLHAGDKQVIEIRFSIDRNGRVLKAAPSAPSGNAVLDQSAARIILNASPLPRPPPDLRGNQIELSFAVEVYR